jgi:hypothetical protein
MITMIFSDNDFGGWYMPIIEKFSKKYEYFALMIAATEMIKLCEGNIRRGLKVKAKHSLC